jgi:hypothetical protein
LPDAADEPLGSVVQSGGFLLEPVPVMEGTI